MVESIRWRALQLVFTCIAPLSAKRVGKTLATRKEPLVSGKVGKNLSKSGEMRTDGMPGTIKESKPREESERKHLKRIVSSFVEDEMINYEPGDNLKFQVMDYDKKGHCTHVPTKQFVSNLQSEQCWPIRP